MENKIKFVRQYELYGEHITEVVYHSMRLYSYRDKEIPKTVLDFIKSHEGKPQHDRWHGEETIFSD